MNKAYRLIWSRVKEAWVIVSEKVKGKGGPSPVTVSLLAALVMAAGSASALPTGPQIVNGSVGINTVGNVMNITNSPSAIINWQGFSIAANEATRFIQQSANSAVLNRVIGGNASQIYGMLQSNGKVFLINQSGILFGPGSRIDVNGLVASTLNITNQDFLAGKLKFAADPLAGKIENQGSITTPSGGQVYLIAADVTNSGVITAPGGEILLAAGKEVLLVERNNPDVALVVSAPDHQALNLGTLTADAGRIGMYGGLVRQKGIVSASSAVAEGGRIFLRATKRVELAETSKVSADGKKGGQIVAMTTENGAVSGSLVGRGELSAQGDGSQGSGGFIETSAAKLDLNDLLVKSGGGTWLIDPENDFTIAPTGGDISGTVLSMDLNYGNIQYLSSQGATVGQGDIYVNDTISWSSPYSLTLKAVNDVKINKPISVSGYAANINLQADYLGTGTTGNIIFGSLDSGTTNGTITTTGTVSLSTTKGAISGSMYGYVTEITSGSLDVTSKTGINYIKPDVTGGITFNNSGIGDVRIYNQNSSGLAKTLTGSNAGGNVIYESYDLTYPATINTLSASGDIILRTNKAPDVSTSVNAGGKVYLSSFNNSPVLPLSIEGTDAYNLTSANLNKINGNTGVVIGNDTFGNTTPNLSVGTSAAVSLSGPKQFELFGDTIAIGSYPVSLSGIGSVMLLNAGTGGISQGSGVAVPNLGINSSGPADFSMTNQVTNLAASVSGSSFTFANSGNLNVGTVGGITGITTPGILALTTTGTLTQSAGALLGSTALYAQGASVVLDQDNPVGVIAGQATGVGATDRFEFKSLNQVTLDLVNDFSGISVAAGAANPLGVKLTSLNSGINQNAVPLLAPGRGVDLSAVNNSIVLNELTNDFGTLSANTAGGMGVWVHNSTALNVQAINAGSGNVQIVAPSLTVSGAVTGNQVGLVAEAPSTGTLALNNLVSSASGVYLQADNFLVSGVGGAVVSGPSNGVKFATTSDNRPITLGGACVTSPCLLLTDLSEARFSGGLGLVIGEADPALSNTAGTISMTTAVSRPTSGLALMSGGSIEQTAPFSGLGMVAVAGGAITLTNASNAFGQFAAKSGGGGVSVASSTPLTISSIPDPTGGIPFNGIFSTNSPISITSSGGSIALGAPVDAGTSSIVLNSAGPLSSSGNLFGTQLSATATGGIFLDGTLSQINLTNNGTGAIWYGGGTGVNVVANMTNNAPGGLAEISLPNGGDLTLTGVTTSNGNFNAFVTPGNVTIGGNLAAGTGQIQVNGGNVSYAAGVITGKRVSLRATTPTSGVLTLGGQITAGEEISLEADNLALSSPVLTVANTSIRNEIGIHPLSSGRPVFVGGTGAGLSVPTISTSIFNSPTLVIGDDGVYSGSPAGPITVMAPITWPQRLALVTGSTVTQNTGATITANEFGVLAGGNVSLAEPGNAVANFVARLTAGNLTFTSSLPLSVVEVTGGTENPELITGVSALSGTVAVATTGGNLTLAAPVDAGGGAVSLSSSGSILDTSSYVAVVGGSLSASAGGDIGAVAAPLLTKVSQWANLVAGGAIYAENYGAVTTGTSTVTASGGGVVLRAHSPLTIGSGGVSAAGDILLEAMATVSTSTTDILTLDGPVKAVGNLELTAGNAIVENVTVSAGGTITRKADQNNPQPTPTPTPEKEVEKQIEVATNQLVKDTEVTVSPTTNTAPTGLVLVAETSQQGDEENVAGQPGDNDDQKKQQKDDTGQQQTGGGKKDDKPKKNYCN